MQLNNNPNIVTPEKSALYYYRSDIKQAKVNPKVKLLQYGIDHNLKFDFFDEAESTKNTRPVKQKLLKRLRKGEYKEVIIYKLDRWAKSSSELILEIKELLDKGIRIVSIEDNIEFNTSASSLQFQILSAFAEFESSLTSKNKIGSLKKVVVSNSINLS